MASLADLLTGKIPPHSLEAERAVLGGMLLDRESLPKAVEFLKPSDFYKEGHRKIFDSMLALFERNEPADLLTVSEDLRRRSELDEVGGPATLGALVEEAATAVHLLSYAEIVREHAMSREMIRLHTDAIARVYANAQPTREILADTTTQLATLLARTGPAVSATPRKLVMQGGGDFISVLDENPVAYIAGVLSDEGGGWLGGEEKLGKSWYMAHEALCLGFAFPVCGRFAVAQRRRVVVLEEEDSPRRLRRRNRALLRGHGLDPDAPDVCAEFNTWVKISAWSGFSLDNTSMMEQLRQVIIDFKPDVIYIDCLRKVTVRNLNHAEEASVLLGALDELRREFGCIFRLIHHYRKQQGFRTARGSQEIGGSYVLGAWGENSLFFEPIGRKAGAVRVEVQAKDSAPVPGFRLRIETEGPSHAPTLVRLVAEDEVPDTSADDVLLQAIASLPATEPLAGKAGVSRASLATTLKRSEASVRKALSRLEETGRVLVVGQATKKAVLYAVPGQS